VLILEVQFEVAWDRNKNFWALTPETCAINDHTMVKIGIIGTGGVGVALATGWVAKGHAIVFGSRDPTSNKSKEVLNKVKNCKVVSIVEAIQQSDVLQIFVEMKNRSSLSPDTHFLVTNFN
jgi:lactate dehydrogenase-like 2-hydroxyacid dehydrogenase